MNNRVAAYINDSLSFQEEYFRIFGKQLGTGKVFCPFHVNVNTPAAKLYNNVLKCFSCGRVYTVYDLLYKFDKERITQIKQQSILMVKDTKIGNRSNRVKIVPRSKLDLDQPILSVITRIVEETQV